MLLDGNTGQKDNKVSKCYNVSKTAYLGLRKLSSLMNDNKNLLEQTPSTLQLKETSSKFSINSEYKSDQVYNWNSIYQLGKQDL